MGDEMQTGTETADMRQCRECKAIFPYTPEHYPANRGRAQGTLCRTCSRIRKRTYDAKYSQARIADRTRMAAETPAVTIPPASGTVVAVSGGARPGELPYKQLEVARALRVGAERLNEAAAGILATILEYAANTQSPHHEWALKLIAERVIPKKLYEDLGSQAAGIKSGQGTVRPAVTIIVQQAGPVPPDPSQPAVQIIDVTPLERSE